MKRTHKINKDKLKFYDNAFWIGLWALTISFISFFIGDINNNFHLYLSVIIGIIGLIGIGIFNWGMLYHIIKGKYWGWLTFFILSFFVIGGFIVTIPFYFITMRKKFNY